jgi:hypothetical protein
MNFWAKAQSEAVWSRQNGASGHKDELYVI